MMKSIVFSGFALIVFCLATFSQTLTRGPYLQKLTPTSISIKWKTSIAAQSKVRYGTDTLALTSNVTNTSSVITHSITLTGLTPATKYYYSIGSPIAILQGNGQNYFITSPPVGQEGSYNFWLVGDCGNLSVNQAQVRDQYITYMGNTPTNAWMLLGDNAYTQGTDAQFQSEFFNVYQGNIMKHAPLYPVPGNHDYNNGLTFSHAVPYYSIFDMPTNAEAGGTASGTQAYYSYDYGNVHFIALDSYGKEDGVNRMSDTLGPQAIWLKQDLANNTNRQFVVVYWHHPPYTMGSHNSDTEAELIPIHTNFIRIIERYKVDLVVCGHSHTYERSRLMKGNYGSETTFNAATHNISQSNGMYDGTSNSCTYQKDSIHGYNGTVYVVAGSAGQLSTTVQTAWPHNAMTAANNHANGGSVLLTITANRLDLKWICADGVIRDKFTLIKDANKRSTQTIYLGQSTTLTASWPGQYYWSGIGATTRNITVSPTATTMYAVRDQYQCVVDSFKVIVLNQTILPNIAFTSACVGNGVSIPYIATGLFQASNVFTAELSDASGLFTSPQIIGTLSATSSGTIGGIIPPFTSYGNGYRIRITSSNPVVTGQNNGSNLTLFTIPTLAGIISGPSVVCALTTASYSITAVAGGGSYTWTVPSPMTLVSGQGTTSIVTTIPAGTLTGNISVTATNNCGTSTPITLAITKKPATPGVIAGPTSTCAQSTATWSIAPVFGATSYVWTLPSGITITSGAGTTQINVSIVSTFIYGQLKVSAVNACGNVAGATLNITGNVPATPVYLYNTTNVCNTNVVSYSCSPTQGASNYVWTVPSSLSIISGQGTTVISCNVINIAVAGSVVSVIATNVCGSAPAKVSILVTTSNAPGLITGPLNTCSLTSATYSVLPVAGAISYNWTPAVGQTIVWGQGTTSISVNIDSGTTTSTAISYLKVTCTNGCGVVSAVRQTVITRCLSPQRMIEMQNEQWSIYPNPAFTLLTVAGCGLSGKIELFDVFGKCVKSFLVEKEEVTIEVSDLAKGIYFIKLLTEENEIRSQTIVIE